MPTNQSEKTAPEPCVGCGSVLAHDQRYCLQCGARQGRPRIDFTAFWKPPSASDGRHEQGPSRMASSQPAKQGSADSVHAASTSGGWSLFGSGAPSRGLVGALAAATLAVGIVAGAALGPAPASSPADSATLAQRAIAALIAQASSAQPTGTSSNPPAPAESDVAAASPNANPKTSTTSTKASAPAKGSSSGESTSGAPASEGSSDEGSGSSEGSGSKGSGEGGKAGSGTPVKLPAVKHVWLISLSDESLTGALSKPQANPYLAKQLAQKGTLLSDYTLSASSSLANGIALLSGQGVNLDTEQDCATYTELLPPTVSPTTGIAEGLGCVYPASVKTLPDELTEAGLTWKAYVQSMQAGTTSAVAPAAASATPGAGETPGAGTPTEPARSTVTCRHPELGAADPNHAPVPNDPYLTFRNPFVYFHSLLDGGACASDDVDMTQLQGDLATPANTPSLSWIVPSSCDDGSTTACAPGTPVGPAAADKFLQEIVPQILASAVYRKEGLIAIVPDSAPASTTSAATKPTGALLISPFVRSGVHVSESVNDFSLLKSLARLFGVLPLGHANDPSATSFGASIYRTTK